MNKGTKGYIYGVLAAMAYGLNPIFAVPLYNAGMDPDSVLFFRYLFALPIVASMLFIRGRGFRVHSREVLPLIIMGMLMAFSSLTLFQSYNCMDASISSVLLFVYPIIVVFLMAAYFKEKITIHTLLCLSMAICGIMLLYGVEETSGFNLTGAVLVFISAFCYAVYIVAINTTRLKGLATLKVLFYVLLFGTVIFAIRIYMNGHLDVPDKWYQWGNVLSLAFFPTVVSLACTTRAIRYVGSTPTAILGAFEPITAIFFSITLLGESLSIKEFAGVVLIILAVTLVVERGSVTSKIVNFKKLFPKKVIDRNKKY